MLKLREGVIVSIARLALEDTVEVRCSTLQEAKKEVAGTEGEDPYWSGHREVLEEMILHLTEEETTESGAY